MKNIVRVCSLMEFHTSFKQDPTIPLSNHSLKHEPEPDLEAEYDFPIQDLHQMDSLTDPPFCLKHEPEPDPDPETEYDFPLQDFHQLDSPSVPPFYLKHEPEPEPDPETEYDFLIQDFHPMDSPTDPPFCLQHKPEPDPDPNPETETEYDFPIQDFHPLESLTDPPFYPDYGIHDVISPFSYGSASDDYELMPFDMENGCDMMEKYMGHVGECDPIQDPKPVGFIMPHESEIKKSSGKGKKKASPTKGQWTKEEDRALKQMVEKHGERKWSHIAKMLKGRVGKQCRERWHNHLRPDIKKDFWSEAEDKILIATHAQVGNKWSEIAKNLPGRTENSIKNHWNATKRRQYTTRKCRSKWPKPSLILQNYIKSLNLPHEKSSTKKNKNNDTYTLVNRSSSSSMIEHGFYSSDRFVPNFEFNEVLPEDSLDQNLFQEDSIESLIEDASSVTYGGSGGGSGSSGGYGMD